MATLEPGASFSHPRAGIKSGRVKERGGPCAKQRMTSCLCDLEAICFNWACLGFHELTRVPLQILIGMITGTAIKVMMGNPSSLWDEKKVQTSHPVSRNSEAKKENKRRRRSHFKCANMVHFLMGLGGYQRACMILSDVASTSEGLCVNAT
ncbi:hypothetical protein ACLOJK_019443 [Asimina triloba]